MDHEAALINAFVLRNKRARLIDFLRNPKRRKKALDALYHFGDLDPRFMVEVVPSQQHAEAIAALLTQRGAPPQCHVISTDRRLDGQELPLVTVLARIVGFGGGTLLSCIPGRLGYFEGEAPGDRFLLDRSAAAADGGSRGERPKR
jgi:hypothetical protein